jgi:HPt (histidine-containing phosphotransfer) domain-containing protein
MDTYKAGKGSFWQGLLVFLGLRRGGPVGLAAQKIRVGQAVLRRADANALDLESLGRLRRKIDRRLSQVDGIHVLPPFPLSGDGALRTGNAVREIKELAPELLSIFIDETHDVLESIGRHLQMLRIKPRSHESLTAIRRGFHTLKGSGRMVGLADLGDVAWGMEQIFNRWLQLKWPATPALVGLIGSGHREFTLWVRQIERHAGNLQEGRELAAAWVRQPEPGTNAIPFA